MMKYTLDDCDIDNRDDTTTEIIFPNGVTLILSKQNLEDLLQNIEDNK